MHFGSWATYQREAVKWVWKWINTPSCVSTLRSSLETWVTRGGCAWGHCRELTVQTGSGALWHLQKGGAGWSDHQNTMKKGDRLMWAEQKTCINSSIAEGYQKAKITPGLPEKTHCQFAGSRGILGAVSSALLQMGQSGGVSEMIHPFSKWHWWDLKRGHPVALSWQIWLGSCEEAQAGEFYSKEWLTHKTSNKQVKSYCVEHSDYNNKEALNLFLLW